MKLSQKLAAVVFVSACALSTSVTAHESALEQIVSNIVNTAVTNANNEIEIQLEKTLLTASNSISVNNESVPANRIKITDLVATKNTQETEQQDNQTDKADD